MWQLSFDYLLAFNFCDSAFVLGGREETNVSELSYRDLDLLHRLVRVVLDVDIHAHGLAVVVQLLKKDIYNSVVNTKCLCLEEYSTTTSGLKS